MTSDDSGRLLVISRKFPPSIGGTQTVLKNLFVDFNPEEYLVVHDREGEAVERSFKYEDVTVDFPHYVNRLLGKFTIPLFVLLVPVMIWSLYRLNRENDFNKCLLVYPDPFFSVAGYLFCRLTGLDYVLYYHDLFEEAQTKKSRIIQRLLARVFEGPMINNSEKFLVISEGLGEFYRSKWGVEPVILPHSIDLNVIRGRKSVETGRSEDRPGGGPEPIEILYSGRIYDDQFDAVDAFTTAFRHSDLDVKFIITSSLPRKHFEEMGIAKEDTVVKFFETKEELHEAQRNVDILYLPLAFDPPAPLEVNTALPTKLFEYVASMSPVLVHCSKDTYLYKFCRKHDVGSICTSRKQQTILSAISKLADEWEVDYGERIDFLKQFSRKKIYREFRDHIGLNSLGLTEGGAK